MSNKHVILKKVEGENWKNALDKSFLKNVKEAKVDGFRKGKCPRDVFEKKYGIEALYNDAVDIVLPGLYTEVLKESALEPVVQPSIDIKEINKDGVSIEFTIITAPVANVKKYTGLKVTREKVKVTDEEITEEINRLKDQYAEIAVKEGKIESGDTAVIDFEGFKDGVAFEGGKGENYPLEIGSNTFIPGFEDALIGLSTGDKKDIPLTFPENYPSEELKGAKVVFKVTVHEVKTRLIPELDKDFFTDLGIEGVTNETELRNHVKNNISLRKEKEADNKLVEDILASVAKETEIVLPEELIHDEIHHMIDNYAQRLQMQGLSLEQYMQFTKQTFESLEEQLKPEAKKNITYRYMLEEIAKKEGIVISDEEADNEAETLSHTYQMTKQELINAFGGIEMIKYDLKIRKTIDFLKENN
ncbi:trigger factor [Clostridium sp. CAG:1193]|nr:trigger factor [Clostridium sp. CAG:1193]